MSMNDDIYLKVRAWFYFVLNTEGGLGIPIVQSHQNAPAPDEPYITIDAAGNVSSIGRATKKYPPEEVAPDVYEAKIATDYESIIEVWEIGGTGDLLRMVISSTERAEIQQEYFQKENIVIRGVNNIITIPQLDNNHWTQQAMVELRIGFADSIKEQSSWIETVAYSGEIGGKVNE